MRKYFYIFKSQIMTNLQYIFDVLSGFIGYAMFIFILFQLYRYLYSDPEEIIHGYTLNQMVWYVVITEIIWSALKGRKLCQMITEDVKGGNIAYNINRPYSYIGYILSHHLGDVVVKGVAYSVLGFLLGFFLLGELPSISILGFFFFLLSCAFANIIHILLIIFIGLFAFFIEDSNPFYWMYSKLVLILGTFFPVEYFPKAMQPFLTYTPAYVVSYGPAKLFVDFSTGVALKIFLAQIIYVFFAYGICALIYRKGVRRLNVNGG